MQGRVTLKSCRDSRIPVAGQTPMALACAGPRQVHPQANAVVAVFAEYLCIATACPSSRDSSRSRDAACSRQPNVSLGDRPRSITSASGDELDGAHRVYANTATGQHRCRRRQPLVPPQSRCRRAAWTGTTGIRSPAVACGLNARRCMAQPRATAMPSRVGVYTAWAAVMPALGEARVDGWAPRSVQAPSKASVGAVQRTGERSYCESWD